MAAVICNLVGDLCRNVCNGVSFGCREVCKSEFLPYLALTFGLNTPGVVYGFKSIFSDDCAELNGWLVPNGLFCLLHIVAASYIVKKIREPSSNSELPISAEDATPEKKEEEEATTGFSLMPREDAPGAENSFQRIKYVLCYGKF